MREDRGSCARDCSSRASDALMEELTIIIMSIISIVMIPYKLHAAEGYYPIITTIFLIIPYKTQDFLFKFIFLRKLHLLHYEVAPKKYRLLSLVGKLYQNSAPKKYKSMAARELDYEYY